MTDPAPPCARRGMAVRVPPRGHRVLTYPRPFRPGRRVSTVCVPHRACRSWTGRVWCKRRRVMADPAPRHPTWCGMTVRAPPLRHRVLTYPWPRRPGRRVSTVCVPWRLPPSPRRPATTGCARRACPTPLPIPAPTPTHTPTKTPPTPAPRTSMISTVVPPKARPVPRYGTGTPVPPSQRGDRRGARSCPPRRHCSGSRNPASNPLPVATRTPLPWQGRGRGLGPDH